MLRGWLAFAGLIVWCHPAQSAPPSTAPFLTKGAVLLSGKQLHLADGTELTLAGLEEASLPPDWQKQPLSLYKAGSPDRWNRIPVWLINQEGRCLQDELLEQGKARASFNTEEESSARALLRAEAKARQEKRGLWADPAFAIRDPSQLALWRNTWQVVRGHVESSALSHGDVVLTLGQDWGKGLTIRLSAALRQIFPGDPYYLRGRMILVRGWISGGQQATLTLTHPAQLETEDGNWPPPVPQSPPTRSGLKNRKEK